MQYALSTADDLNVHCIEVLEYASAIVTKCCSPAASTVAGIVADGTFGILKFSPDLNISSEDAGSFCLAGEAFTPVFL